MGGVSQVSNFGDAFQQNRLLNDGIYSYTYDTEGNMLTKLDFFQVRRPG